jgi:hypothetical protein
VYSGGLNIHCTEATQLKLQYMRLHFFDFRDGIDRSKHDAHSVATRLVVAF